jgi:phytoene synthase
VGTVEQYLKSAYRSCARITRTEAKNFYFAFLTLPAYKRRAIYTVYAFFREADDIADGTGRVNDKLSALKKLEGRLEKILAGKPQEKTDIALAAVINQFSIDPAYINCVLDGVRADLTTTRYPTFAELRDYCYKVAAAVGLTVLPILIQRPAAPETIRRHGIDFGLGLQLANIVRDVAEDIDRGRIYIPLEELNRFGVSEDELSEKKLSAGIRAMLAFEVERAREYIHRGEELLGYLPRRSRGCPAMLATLYLRLLDQIEGHSYDVFSFRPSLSKGEKLTLTLRALLCGGTG